MKLSMKNVLTTGVIALAAVAVAYRVAPVKDFITDDSGWF